MGGKSATTTQTVQIPPEVMARYRAVNTRAEEAAQQPFQQYSTDPSAFVAPLTGTQQTAIQNIGSTQNIAQPYYQAGAGLTLSGAQGVGPLTQQQIGYYQNPFTQAVAGTTYDALRQQQQQEMQGATANAIRSGAFGGDRAGLVAANLARQQQLGTAQAMAPIFERGYAQALQTATGQQGVEAQNLQRQLAAGQQIAGIGSGATQTALQAAQGLLGAGTAEQQTQQAGLSAIYNQFLQERGYPFQVAQFLANIAMGTGALSGSTTTTQQPVPFFSDEREKTNVQPLGKGLYAYDYIDDVEAAERGERPMPPKRVGPMAQDIEERAPGLVGEVGGHKVVKGLSPESMGGAVVDLHPGEYRAGYAPGGLVGSEDIRAILEAQKAAFAPFAQAGLYGGSPQQGGAGKPGYVPGGMLPTPKLMTAGPAPRLPDSSASQALSVGREFGLTPKSLYEMGEKGLGALRRSTQTGPSRAAPPPPSSPEALAASQNMPQAPEIEQGYETTRRLTAYGGLVGYAEGGGVDKDDPMEAYGAQGPGIAIPTEQPDVKPLEPAKPPPLPNSILSDILGVAKTAASIYSMSDERMKRGMEPVGELYNGLPVYKYRMGDGPTQLGLSAQEASGLHPGAAIEGPDGLLRLDYDRATRAYGGGLVPRQGYQAGGMPDEEYAIRTIAAEMGGKNPEEARAIAHVINNRLASGRWGESYRDVVQAKSQFEPWMRPNAPNYPMRYRTDEPRFQMAREGFEAARSGEDITGGAMNFYAPAAQAQLARTRGDRAPVPSWARNREYTDFGPTRIVRGVDEPRASGLMAFAGNQPRSVASGAIEDAAGRAEGLGVIQASALPARGEAAPARGEAAPVRGGAAPPRGEEPSGLAALLPIKFGTRTVATPKGEQFGGLGEFLTSRQFIQPLLEGVGAMASSPSLSGWGAALQGLGAASRAYTGLEKEMAGTLTEAEQARSQVASQTRTLSEIPNDRLVMFFGRNGRIIVATKGQFERMRKAGEPVTFLQEAPQGAAPSSETSVTDQKPVQGTPGSTEAARPQPPISMDDTGRYTVAPTPEFVDRELMKIAPIATAVNSSGGKFDPETLEYAVLGSPSLASTNESARKKFDTLSNSVTDINQKIFDLRKYTQEIAKISEGTVTGAGAGFDPRIAAARIYDTTARILGLGGLSERERQDLSAAEITNKLRNLMSSDVARQAGQRAFGMFEAISSALPSGEMTKDAALDLLSAMLVQAQKNKDLQEYQTNFRNRYGVLIESERLFNQQSAKYYDDMRKAMKKAFTGVRIGGTDRSPQVVNPAQLLIEGKVTPRGFDRHIGLPGVSRILTEN